MIIRHFSLLGNISFKEKTKIVNNGSNQFAVVHTKKSSNTVNMVEFTKDWPKSSQKVFAERIEKMNHLRF
ncbi:hypothetical protein [Bacillus massilioanorexius]|uniref:hypothetical protein n=1 Tax=Bacillus massilioanorexius TaxID=1468413 RepID=UPI0002F622A5|nr:hypothetical protein [Bacillus massilioanorexius]